MNDCIDCEDRFTCSKHESGCDCPAPPTCPAHAPRPLKYGDAKHTTDAECTLDENGVCTGCSTFHGDPCEGTILRPTGVSERCGGRGFHRQGCSESDAS